MEKKKVRRGRKKKPVNTEVESVKAEIKVEPVIPDYLSDRDLLEMQVASHNVSNAKLEMALQEQHVRNLNLELELLKVKINKEMNIQQQKSHAYSNFSDVLSNLVQNLTEKYQVKGNFSYDSRSGKIIR